MYTQCPKCLTYFQVTAEHLKVAQGNVRCGQCSNVFSALGNLSEVPPQAQAADNKTTPSTKAKPNSNTRNTSPSATDNNAQSKLSSAIAAIQALNQSSQKILSQGRKNYVTQLQRQAQAQRRYSGADAGKATARNLNQSEPESEQLQTAKNNLADIADIDFDQALAAVDDIDIDIESDTVIDIEESPIQYGAADDEDITPAFDGSHLVEDYNIEDSQSKSEHRGQKKSRQKPQSAKSKSADDEFDFSEINLPDTEENTSTGSRKKPAEPVKTKQPDNSKRRPATQKATQQKTAKPSKKPAVAIPQHIVEAPEVVIENNIPTLAIPKQLLEDFERDNHVSPAHYRSMITWGILSLMLMFVFLGQAIYFKHNELGQVSQLRPYIEFFCRHASCELSMQMDIGQIELLGQDIRSHPKNKKALLVSATIINNAPFTQAYPGLRLSFSDINGEKVASRNFLPENYLPKGINITKGMESNIPIQLELEIVDPGKNAVNFEFDFFSI